LGRQHRDAGDQTHAEDEHQHVWRESRGEIGLIVGASVADNHQRHGDCHEQPGAPEHHG
jgi:hypothetical protein